MSVGSVIGMEKAKSIGACRRREDLLVVGAAQA